MEGVKSKCGILKSSLGLLSVSEDKVSLNPNLWPPWTLSRAARGSHATSGVHALMLHFLPFAVKMGLSVIELSVVSVLGK